MRIWMLPASSGAISIADQQLILLHLEISSETLPTVIDEEYIRRYLWDTH